MSNLMFQGWAFPVPDDDILSCAGHESPNTEHKLDDFTVFEAAPQPLAVLLPPQQVCRAASGSDQQLGFSASMGAGDNAHHKADPNIGELFSTDDGVQSYQGRPEHMFCNFEDHGQPPIGTSEPVDGAPHGNAFLSILGGAPETIDTTGSSPQTTPGMQNYATPTDCILQNLTMVVGNPGLRCFANAPWRAFTWVCALLQETSAQPWGTLQEAVQESIDAAEPVDIQALTGLRDLWKNHDLNVQGDASHFVNSLWLLVVPKQSLPLQICTNSRRRLSH